jgi:hypothetical protein
MNSDIVFISSVIGVLNEPLTYTKTRSVFTKEERFEQTLETIVSIRKYLPNAKILLVETSYLNEGEIEKIKANVDYFLNMIDDAAAKMTCLYSPKKGFGEAMQTKMAVQYLLENKISYTLFFKISGRYVFTEKFNRLEYSDTEYTFLNAANETPNSISTVVYSVPFHRQCHFIETLDKVIETYSRMSAVGLEEVLPVACVPRKHIHRIGVEGLVSVTGTYFSC